MSLETYIPTIYPLKLQLSLMDLYTIFSKEKDLAFLDSGDKIDSSSQYSFLCFDGFLQISYEEGQTHIDNEAVTDDFFQAIKKTIGQYPIVNHTAFPFVGGAVGYISYDYSFVNLNLPPNRPSNLEKQQIPLGTFRLYDTVLIYEHHSGNIFLSCLGISNQKEVKYHYVLEKIQDFIKRTSTRPSQNCHKNQEKIRKTLTHEIIEKNDSPLISNVRKRDYLKALKNVKEYIRQGHVYIMNMTHQFHGEAKIDETLLYKKLRASNAAPFSGHFRYDNHEILSSSPERFLKIHHKKVITCPIKGTVKRSDHVETDKKNKDFLLNSEKDKSELLMIVDLERNDLSKTCKPHSVKVNRLFELETYETVHHLVAEIEGILEDEQTAVDCLKECFPGGSITGAPKERAIEIIDELEEMPRGLYTGTMGYFGFDGNADFNIVIRTLHLIGPKLLLGVGGGITWESNIEMEYYETLDKASRLLEVLAECSQETEKEIVGHE